MKKSPSTPRPRRRFHQPRRSGPVHASAGIAQAAASLYFRLARGSAAQREAAEEWKSMFLNLGQS